MRDISRSMTVDAQESLKRVSGLVSPEEAINDYRICYRSRQASLIGRREVLTGKAKFGILEMVRNYHKLQWPVFSGLGIFALDIIETRLLLLLQVFRISISFLHRLYANPDVEADPFSAGRQMNNHFATRMLDEDGDWKDLTEEKLTSADASSTASQMPRMVGLVQASKLYRNVKALPDSSPFSNNGNEVVFGTIGNASCAEGPFWEAINAIGIIQGPFIMSIWDDEYGISVPNKYQITKSNLSEMLSGFQRTEVERGYEILTAKAWDYEDLLATYEKAEKFAREEHIPVIVHVQEVTQPQGHSTSGSHERYKSPERLKWEKEHDCLVKMREWLEKNEIAGPRELDEWEKEDRKWVRKVKNESWKKFQDPIKKEMSELLTIASQLAIQTSYKTQLQQISLKLKKTLEPSRRDLMAAAHRMLIVLRESKHPLVDKLRNWRIEKDKEGLHSYGSHLYSESAQSPLNVPEVKATYEPDAPALSGFEVLNKSFDILFERDARLIAFGEDVGYLGDVNQGFAGLQKKYGSDRIMDTGIREATIIGQAIGLAMRGLRPIAEIQYLDYLLYGLQILSDDLATLHYRTRGGQKAPAIIRTRGHRLEGIWHAGSPLGMMLHALRGIHIVVPRNMTQAAGFYNTFLKGDDPAIVIEVLNGYRLKEKLPDNLGEFTVPLGVPELLRRGTDLTLVTYGACCRIAMTAAQQLEQVGISTEIIDVQSLQPFDRKGMILESLKKTNKILFVDEDVPGGATAYMMQNVIEEQGGYYYLDSEPRTLSGTSHRPAYGDDGDYWSKPQVESIFRMVYEMMNEAEPEKYPIFF